MTEDKVLSLTKRLDSLRSLHRNLDDDIKSTSYDEFTLLRKKREKLNLRDQIMQIENVIYPDIIA